jgi:hypothetical protein
MGRHSFELLPPLDFSNADQSAPRLGSNHRLRRFLAKASRRQGFTVGLIGGSITAGHGLPRHDFTEKEPHRPNNLGRIIFDFLNERFPAPDGAAIGEEAIDSSKRQNVFVNGAQGGQGGSIALLIGSLKLMQRLRQRVLLQMLQAAYPRGSRFGSGRCLSVQSVSQTWS